LIPRCDGKGEGIADNLPYPERRDGESSALDGGNGIIKFDRDISVHNVAAVSFLPKSEWANVRLGGPSGDVDISHRNGDECHLSFNDKRAIQLGLKRGRLAPKRLGQEQKKKGA
jgi:hypothetical protein